MKSEFINCKNCTDDCRCKGKDITPICVSFKPAKTTNADKLRSMTDEELATFIDEFWSSPWCPDDPPVDQETKRCLLHDGDCRLCILDWLKQEVSDNG